MFGTEQGQRVLLHIYNLCQGPVVPPAQIDNHGLLAMRNGMRWVGELINRCFVVHRKTEVENQGKQNV